MGTTRKAGENIENCILQECISDMIYRILWLMNDDYQRYQNYLESLRKYWHVFAKIFCPDSL